MSRYILFAFGTTLLALPLMYLVIFSPDHWVWLCSAVGYVAAAGVIPSMVAPFGWRRDWLTPFKWLAIVALTAYAVPLAYLIVFAA